MKQPYSRDLPTTHMCNPARTWIGSAHTDIRVTFERIRQEQAKQQMAADAKAAHVLPLHQFLELSQFRARIK